MTDLSPRNRSDQRTARDARRRRQARTRRTWLAVALGVGVLLVASAVAWTAIRPLIASFGAPEDFPGPGTGEVRVVVPEGASGTAIGQELVEAGVIKSVDAFVGAAADDSRAAGIQPGEYQLRREMSAQGALDVLVDPANRDVSTVTIKEGVRLKAILEALAKATGLPVADFEAAAGRPAELGLPAQAGGLVEGWLFPATYEIGSSTTPADLLSQMVARTVAELTDLAVPPEQWERTIILASLVEAERGSDEDAAKIARVLENRLVQKIPLQLDTTVNYALDRYKVGVSLADLEVDSPYNTYKIAGLPQGAICSPGRVAIEGVLDPAEGSWRYFVAVNPDTGETRYGATEAEFAAMKAELDRWLAANPGR